jgi:hypothetical protein
MTTPLCLRRRRHRTRHCPWPAPCRRSSAPSRNRRALVGYSRDTARRLRGCTTTTTLPTRWWRRGFGAQVARFALDRGPGFRPGRRADCPRPQVPLPRRHRNAGRAGPGRKKAGVTRSGNRFRLVGGETTALGGQCRVDTGAGSSDTDHGGATHGAGPACPTPSAENKQGPAETAPLMPLPPRPEGPGLGAKPR